MNNKRAINNKIQDTLFTDNFPIIESNSNEEMKKIKKKYSRYRYDEYYIVSGCSKSRREKFDKLWNVFKLYADKHFPKQYKYQFHQRSWEMYVSCVLLNNNLSIKSLGEGPDFVVSDNHYVECVACNNAKVGKPDYVPELRYGVEQDVSVDKIIMRVTSVIEDKYKKYKGWIEKGIISKDKPYVIAINSGVFQYP